MAEAKFIGGQRIADLTARERLDVQPYFSNYTDSPMSHGYNSRIEFDWEIGYILNGNNLARTYAIRTVSPVTVEQTLTVKKMDSRMKWLYVTYSSDGTYESTSQAIANNEYEFVPVSGKK